MPPVSCLLCCKLWQWLMSCCLFLILEFCTAGVGKKTHRMWSGRIAYIAQMRPIATDATRSMVCMYVCACVGHAGELRKKRVSRSRCRLGADSCGSKEPCRQSRSDESIRRREWWQYGDAAFCQNSLLLLRIYLIFQSFGRYSTRICRYRNDES